ncbi:MAG TPA: PAS domain S-box protein [Anaerolineae bacterium]|nr:PAS domain S-box protein [Anaerolineae bacterium]
MSDKKLAHTASQPKPDSGRRAQSRRRPDETAARFRDVAELTADWIWETDVTGRYTYCSERVRTLLGYEVAEVIGKTFLDLALPEEAARLQEEYATVFAARQPLVNLENVKCHKEGQLVYVQTNALPIWDADGAWLGYRGVDRDVTAIVLTKQAQQAAEAALETDRRKLAEQQLFLRQVLDINPNFVFVRDREGRFILANQAIAESYGTTVEGLVGKTDADFNKNKDEVAAIWRADLEVMDSLQEKFIVESLIAYGGKQERWVQTIKRPLIDPDGVARHVLGVSSDITERRRMQQVVEASWERRGRQVQTSTEVAQEIAAATGLEELFLRVVTLVKERFGYYHAQIFRYDPDFVSEKPGIQAGAMRLVCGYGRTGQAMLAAGHHLAMGRGVVGTAALTGVAVLASDVAQDPDWVPNPFLPKTRGELAVPIKLRNEILGILDVQSDVVGALTAEDQLLLEGLCGQIALAIESTQLLSAASTFRQMIESSGQGIGMATLEGRITYVNPMLCRLVGEATVADMVGQSFWNYYPDYAQKQLREQVLPTVHQEGRWQGELELITHEGVIVPTWENMFLIHDQEGAPLYLASQVTDITEIKLAEAMLRESEVRYRALFEQANDAIFVENEAEEIVEVNKRACQMFGYTREEFAKMKTSALQRGSSGKPLPVYADQETGAMFLESRAEHKDGTPLFIEVTITPLEVGQQRLILSSVRDITARKATEAALARERFLLQTLMENVPDHIYFKDTDSRYIRINRALATWLGLAAPEQAIGKTDADFFSAEHAERAYKDEQRLMQDGQAIINQEEKETWLDGRVTWVSTTKLQMLDEKGETSGTFGISRDITEHKYAEEILRETQQLLEGILDNTTAVIYVKDLQGRYLLINRRYEALFNVQRTNVVGKTAYDLFPPEVADQYWANDLAVVQAGVPQEEIEHAVHADGEHTYLSLKFLITDAKDAPYAVCSISTDITEREATEVERQRLLADLATQTQQLQTALAETAALYRASQAINVALTMDELLSALMVGVELPGVVWVGLYLFNRPWRGEDVPEFAETVAVWDAREEHGAAPRLGVGVRVDLRGSRLARQLRADAPVIFAEVANDARVDAELRAQFRDVFQARSAVYVPLIAGGQWVGYFNPILQTPVTLDAARLRRLLTLASQAATVLQNLNLLQEAQTRAQRQEALREIATLVGDCEDRAELAQRLPGILAPLRQLALVDELAVAIYTEGETEFTLFSEVSRLTSDVSRGVRMSLEGAALGWVLMNHRFWLEPDMRGKHTFSGDDRLVSGGIASRLLLPLESGGHLIGALGLSSTQAGAFTEQDLPILHPVANQIAQALERTRLLENMRVARDEVEATHRSYLRQGWQEHLQAERQLSQTTFVYDQEQVLGTAEFWRPEMVRAVAEGAVVTRLASAEADESRTGLVAPIMVRGQVLGVLGFEDPEGKWSWSPEQLTLVQAVAQQLGQVLENARLIEATQSRAARERMVDEVSSTIRRSLELDAVLRAAVDELREALQLAEVEVRLG